ncbi:Fic family protein [Ruminococcus sp.]|uniref:Fic family protein n=1 Tax=Ruminococcus sp. TaxID=41978 RepID=UPI0029310FF0|nr:Fic family protein [Ruminococcus sp.]MBQ2358969.1 Fic family protein [Ruminococcus sp.]MEE1264446.1 Fic family protein [Ruminococcus sp.]
MSDKIPFDFDEYIRQSEPGKQQKGYIWQTAIGLQDVDGLKPSEYLIETAKKNIDGDITLEEANDLIHSYYKSKTARLDVENRTEEADKVSARIAQILSEDAFVFSPNQLIAIHRRLFDGIYKFAGTIRDYNISKKEWILKGKSVVYAGADTIKDTMKYDFDLEKSFDYSALSIDESIKHITGFIANMWQIHPFGEGNTRTTAVFAIKYLRSLGFNVTNTLFADNSWYFRNALVRANYADIQKGIFEDKTFLERFFRNLLLDEQNELKNRYLIIGADLSTTEIIGDNEKIGDKKSAINKRTKQAILVYMKGKEFVKARDVAEAINLKPSRTRDYLGELVKEGLIISEGSNRNRIYRIKK